MSQPPRKKVKLTDAERHQRFVAVAREAEASEDAEDFDKVFEGLTTKPSRSSRHGDEPQAGSP